MYDTIVQCIALCRWSRQTILDTQWHHMLTMADPINDIIIAAAYNICEGI